MSFFTILTLLTGCFKDKGNYDYVNINRITIGDLKSASLLTINYGEELVITPELTFENGIDDDSNLKFQWDLEGKVRPGWDKRVFSWVADTITQGNLTLRITDLKNDMVYLKSIGITVAAEFNSDGIYVLSEKDGNSSLSFIKLKLKIDFNIKRTTVSEAKIYANIYEERSKSVLGQGPLLIHEHFRRKDNLAQASSTTQLLVLQKSGMVDVATTSMTKDIDMTKTFLDGTYPPSVNQFNEASFMKYTDVLTDQEGRLYSRIRSVVDLFHSSYFFPEPLKFDDEVLKNCKLIPAIFSSSKFMLFYDGGNNRFLTILDSAPSSWDGPVNESSGKIVSISKSSSLPENFVPLDDFGDNEYIGGNYYEGSYSAKICYFMIFKNAAGEYIGQSFDLEKTSNSSTIELSNAKATKINLPGRPTIVYPTPHQSDNLFIAIGNKLYLYDRLNNAKDPKVYLTFDSDIVSINAETFLSRWGMVSTSNGKVYVLDCEDAKNLDDKEKIIYEIPSNIDLGRIVDAKLRIGGGSIW